MPKEESPASSCKHIRQIGERVVYVCEACPKAHKIRGVLVASKKECKECDGKM